MIQYARARTQAAAMSDVHVMAFYKTVLGKDPPTGSSTKIDGGEALLLWVANLLQRTPFVESAHSTLLLQELGPSIIEIGQRLERTAPDFDGIEPYVLTFSDRRFVGLAGRNEFFDLKSGTTTEIMSRPALETISYSCAVMFVRNYRALENQDAPVAANHGKAKAGA
jgi:hypothetical protein